MGTPTRFPSGISTAARNSTLSDYPGPDPTKCHVFFDDFDTYTAAQWVVTEVNDSTQALTDVNGGVLLITTTGAENDGSQMQKVGESFKPAAGKKIWFKSRFTISDITQSDFAIGLMVTDTTAIAAAGDGVLDGMFFQKDDASVDYGFFCQCDATTGQLSTLAVGRMPVAGTYVTLGFYFDGVRYIKLYQDDVHVGTADLTATLATYLPDTELTPTVAFLTGAAAAITLSLDYLFVAQER